MRVDSQLDLVSDKVPPPELAVIRFANDVDAAMLMMMMMMVMMVVMMIPLLLLLRRAYLAMLAIMVMLILNDTPECW
jgi:hypothetical protein